MEILKVLALVVAGLFAAVVGAVIVAATATAMEQTRPIKSLNEAIITAIGYIVVYTVFVAGLTLAVAR
jgi:uncharacterized membrane protein YvlD (DUF360 family)